jgi:hypothetical protein
MKRFGYVVLALTNLVLFLATAISATALAMYMVRKEMAVIRRTGCGPTHCPDGGKAEFPVYGAGAVIVVIIALVLLLIFFSGLRTSLPAKRKAKVRQKQKRLTAATCRKGDNQDTPGVRHAWQTSGGEDRRGPAEGYPRGRVRWYSSSECSNCGSSKFEMSPWEAL